MHKLPMTITWAVVHLPAGGLVARCKEASSPGRLAAFERRHEGRVVYYECPWGKRWNGQDLTPHERKILRNNIYRHQKCPEAAKAEPPPQFGEYPPPGCCAILREAARQHEISLLELLRPPKTKKRYARARGYAACLLRDRAGLSLPQIAEVLGWKDHGSVRYWLRQPINELETPYETKKEASCTKPKGTPIPPSAFSLEKTSASGSAAED
jgi:hypothetical protein